MAGVADGRVDHGLLVAGEVVGQVRAAVQLGLQQRLADAGDVAVAEDAEAPGDQPLLAAVALGVLGGQEPDERLRDGEPDGHACLLGWVSGSRGSSSWCSQVPRIQACSGSSVKRHARSPGPAMTLR